MADASAKLRGGREPPESALFQKGVFRLRSARIQSLHYVEGPANGPPLLLLHGVLRNATDWDLLLPALTQEWHVIALDHRGHGDSERVLSREYRVRDYARDAVDFVRGLQVDSLTIIGHSLGAMVAAYVAAECGESILRIILEDPPFHTMGRRIHETPYQSQFAGMQRVARQQIADLEELVDALSAIEVPTTRGIVRLGELRDRAALLHSARCLQQVDPEVMTPLIDGTWLDGFEHETLWPHVACQVLILQGDPACGGALTDADLQLAHERLPCSGYVRFPGVGHQIHTTRPQEFLRAFDDRG